MCVKIRRDLFSVERGFYFFSIPSTSIARGRSDILLLMNFPLFLNQAKFNLITFNVVQYKKKERKKSFVSMFKKKDDIQLKQNKNQHHINHKRPRGNPGKIQFFFLLVQTGVFSAKIWRFFFKLGKLFKRVKKIKRLFWLTWCIGCDFIPASTFFLQLTSFFSGCFFVW